VGELSDELNALSGRVIGAAIAVHSALGAGYAESVYEEALCVELEFRGIAVERQVVVSLSYRGRPIGTQRLDLVAANAIVLELKAVEHLAEIHFAQLLSYLKATRLQLGLLLNFNVPSLRTGIRRVINTPERR
jgi:GxxExxY protein